MYNKAMIIQLLYEMARADNRLDQREAQFLFDIGKRLYLDTATIESVLSSKGRFPLKPPKTDKERMTVLYYLLFQMKIDGKVADEERGMVRKVGLRLGFRGELTDDLIQIIQSHVARKIPVEIMLNEIRKYLN